MSWSEEEFEGVKLGDMRLTKRLMMIGSALYENPESTINEAFDGWSETKAVYRFFDNEKVDAEKILEIHRIKTIERMKAHEVVLAVQDTTFFNYNNHTSTTGLGIINSNKVPVKGLLAHNTLITTTEGLPLGLFSQKIYARKNKTKRSRPNAPIQEKESSRWLKPIRELAQCKKDGQRCIMVADRESDIFELMHSCKEEQIDFIVRSTHNRAIGERKRRWGDEKNNNEHLLEYAAKQPEKAEIELEFDDKLLKRKRTAKLKLSFFPVKLPAPWRLDYGIDEPTRKNGMRAQGTRLSLEVYVVEAKEVAPPAGAQKLHWRLLTSISVSHVKEAIHILELYKVRWTIEIYHRVLKSGCQIEARRLSTFDRLERCITLFSIIAWRLLWITRHNQLDPNQGCTKILTDEEWQALYKIVNKTQSSPQEPPTVRQAVRWIARLGGFLGRKSDGEPGIVTVWRGWKKLNTYLSLKNCG